MQRSFKPKSSVSAVTFDSIFNPTGQIQVHSWWYYQRPERGWVAAEEAWSTSKRAGGKWVAGTENIYSLLPKIQRKKVFDKGFWRHLYLTHMCLLDIFTDTGATEHCRLHFRPVLPRTKRKDTEGTARGGGKLGKAPHVHGAKRARAAACETALLFPQHSNSLSPSLSSSLCLTPTHVYRLSKNDFRNERK